MAKTMTKASRAVMMEGHRAVWDAYLRGKIADDLAEDVASALREEMDAFLQSYFDTLPRVVVGRCPFCDALIRHSFDPFGFDGYWWQEESTMTTVEPKPCIHFGVLQGAVSLATEQVQGGEKEARLGPGVPFVIPRILSAPQTKAVVTELAMEDGHRAFAITYYADPPQEPTFFTQRWTRTSFSFPCGNRFGWRLDTDPWDFELAPWVDAGKVWWIESKDESGVLQSGEDGHCPFIDLEGVRRRQHVREDNYWTIAPPSGEELDPFSG